MKTTLIEYITRMLEGLDESRLRMVYHFILHLSK